MKYGKQQWARVASLLNRKSAKQCKARWNEWLDPSVRKVEWSRSEDEKLLHLAKLLPAQWKTIGPLLGRTATQCQERYERLLDEAAAAASGEAMAVEEDGKPRASVSGISAARKLRPGEIDPHPETKPARPDPIDMDEDEIEMLQEARARLANTQGKKAKRKQREKMLAEAKRLADLQKRRELKAAGLLSGEMARRARKRQREIDLGVEIPFHKPAPAGFHDVSDEKAQTEAIRSKRLKQANFSKINEDQYRSRDREAKLAQKKEESRLRSLERSNMQLAVATASAKSDPTSFRNRSTLSMPVPKINEEELANAAKLKHQSREQVDSGLAGGVTDSLLGDYSKVKQAILQAPIPASTASVSKSEMIQREAQNLLRLERGDTPLLGGENPELHAGGAGTGASLRTTPRDDASTIVTSATHLTKSSMAATATTFGGTIRDVLGLNRLANTTHHTDDASSFVGSTLASTAYTMLTGKALREKIREERRAAKRARQELEEALASLPAPQFEYELAVPKAVTDDENDEKKARQTEMDQADVELAEQRLMEEKAAKMYEAQSTVLKRNAVLPRPSMTNLAHLSSIKEWVIADAEFDAHRLIYDETLRLMKHDAVVHPPLRSDSQLDPKSSKKQKKGKQSAPSMLKPEDFKLEPLEFFPEESIIQAKELLAAETQLIEESARKNLVLSGKRGDIQELDSYLASQNVSLSKVFAEEDPESAKRAEHVQLNELLKAAKKRNDKLEQKLAIQNGGYVKKCESLVQSYDETNAACRLAEIELGVFGTLALQEKRAIASRLLHEEKFVAQLEKCESQIQQEYGTLLHERSRLMKRLEKQPAQS